MKQTFKCWMGGALMTLLYLGSFAQEKNPAAPKWHSEKGYWVVESNIHSPLQHEVRFYNNDNLLLYRETLTGIKLDPTRRSVKMKLKKILDSSAEAWQGQKRMEENKDYVMAILKRA